MKKVILFLMATTLIITSCRKACKENDCKKEYGCDEIIRPSNLKPIDWNNYNDVYTVYWNLSDVCSKEDRRYNEESVIIKVSGWKAWSYDLFSLCDEPKYANQELRYTGAYPIITVKHFAIDDSLFNAKMDTSDLKKKCYITGRILMAELPTMYCCLTIPEIHLYSIDDIYFE
ncbi:MAG: hypothetical protein LBQ64_03455 [Bacteroidales bacterium]|jgi:hypothetical protein|nr:hypothetical protein [Bacteroidales bacterium]